MAAEDTNQTKLRSLGPSFRQSSGRSNYVDVSSFFFFFDEERVCRGCLALTFASFLLRLDGRSILGSSLNVVRNAFIGLREADRAGRKEERATLVFPHLPFILHIVVRTTPFAIEPSAPKQTRDEDNDGKHERQEGEAPNFARSTLVWNVQTAFCSRRLSS